MSSTRPRSTFVTVLAWISIAMSGPGTLISIVQNVMIHVVFRDAGLEQALQAAPEGVPPPMLFMAAHARLLFFGAFVVSLFTLVSSVGLLRRYDWARLCFIAVMALGIIAQLAGLAVQSSMLSMMRTRFAATAGPGGPDMAAMAGIIAMVGGLMATGMIVLQAWIILRLLSARVVAEFRR